MINLPRATGREGGCPPRGDISDSVVLTVKNGGGGTFGRKCPALGEPNHAGRQSRLAAPGPLLFSSLGALSGGVWMISRASSCVRAAPREDAGPQFQQGPCCLRSHPAALGSPEFPHSWRQEGRYGHLICLGRWLTADKQQLPHPCWGVPSQTAHPGSRREKTPRAPPALASLLQPRPLPDSFGQSDWTPPKTRASTQHGAARSPCHPDVGRALSSFTVLCCLMFSHITLTTTREERRAGVYVSILQMSKQPQDVRQPCPSSHS